MVEGISVDPDVIPGDEPPKYPDCPLPRKASALIRVALADLEKSELDDRYRIYMGTWHEVVETSDLPFRSLDSDEEPSKAVCLLCFAGAVMAQTCKVPMGVDAFPTDFPPESMVKFTVLDSLRKGHLVAALFRLDYLENDALDYVNMNDSPSNQIRSLKGIPRVVPIPQYENSPDDFRLAMEGLANQLEAAGL